MKQHFSILLSRHIGYRNHCSRYRDCNVVGFREGGNSRGISRGYFVPRDLGHKIRSAQTSGLFLTQHPHSLGSPHRLLLWRIFDRQFHQHFQHGTRHRHLQVVQLHQRIRLHWDQHRRRCEPSFYLITSMLSLLYEFRIIWERYVGWRGEMLMWLVQESFHGGSVFACLSKRKGFGQEWAPIRMVRDSLSRSEFGVWWSGLLRIGPPLECSRI